MNRKDVSVATITWARDEKEEKLLQSSLEQLALIDIPVYITDGGSPAHFLEFLRSFPKFFLLQASESGVWPQAKNSLQAAFQSNKKFIIYTEPDKQDFFTHGFLSFLNNVQDDDVTGVALAARSAEGFATFPKFQQMTETTINNCCAEIVGNKFDYTYGPFIMNRNLVPLLDSLQNDIGWGWRPYVFCTAKQLGYNVSSFEAHFKCPAEQRVDNPAERIYRMRQLSQNIEGIVQACKQHAGGT